MLIRDLMTPEPAVCTLESTLAQCARLMAEFDCGELPVVDGEDSMRPIGVITDRDIVIRSLAKGKNPMELTVKDCYSHPPVVLTKSMSIEECCETMARHQVRRFPVVDEKGCCVGMVSQADVVRVSGDETAGEVIKSVSHPAKYPSTGNEHPVQ